jgi:hypothetical protein
MTTVYKAYKKCVTQNKDGDVMGVVRTLFPNIEVETFLENRNKKTRKKVRKVSVIR